MLPQPSHTSALFSSRRKGFDSLVDRSGIAERYDVAFFSSKGQSTIATRQFVDSLSQACTFWFCTTSTKRASESAIG